MEQLLLELVRSECRAATWAFVAGNVGLAEQLLNCAEEFLELRRKGRFPWRPIVTLEERSE